MIRYLSVPKEAKAAIRPHVERWRHLIPTWCHDVTFRWEKTEGVGDVAEVECSVEYRMATVTIDPSWLDTDEAERDSIIRHELLHLALEPLAVFVEEMLSRCVADDSVFRDWTKDELRRRYEGAVVDLAKALSDAPGRRR